MNTLFVQRLFAYRLPAILFFEVLSFLALMRGVIASPVLFESTWPPQLRGHALILVGLAICIAGLLLLLFRMRLRFLLTIGATLALVALTAAFGLAGTAGATVVVACCFTVGHMIEATLGRQRLATVDTAVVGMAIIMLLLVLVAALPINMVKMLWIFLGCTACYVVGSRSLQSRVSKGFSSFLSIPLPQRALPWLTIIPLTLGMFAILFYTAQTALPERYFDALVLHLTIPSQILTFGRWDLDPGVFAYAVSPAAVNYLYTFAYLLGGEQAARLLNLMVLVAILAQMFSMVRPLYGRNVAGLAVLLFLAIPTALIVTASLFIENTLALLTISAIRMMLQQNTLNYRSALIGLAPILGALCAAKLHGVFIAAPIIALTLYEQNHQRITRNEWYVLLLVGALCALLGATPYVIAYLKTGNPIFPYLNAHFKSPYWPPTNFEDTRWMGRISPMLLYRMTFMSADYLEANSGAMGFSFVAFFLPGTVAAIFRPRRDTTVCLVVTAVYATILMSQIQYIRYLYPVFPLMMVICCTVIYQLATVRAWRTWVYAVTLLVVGLGIYKLPSGGWILQHTNIAAVFNDEKKRALIRSQVPVRLANEMINALADKPRVLYATQTIYGSFLKGTPVYVAWYNSRLSTALAAALTQEAIKSVVEQQNVDFIVADNPASTAEHNKILAYARAHAQHIATIESLSIFIKKP